MAAVRVRGQPLVGSIQWIQDENLQLSAFCAQEAEDFTFSARNEVEWLNEHMAEIFSKDQVYDLGCSVFRNRLLIIISNVTDIFKTPGKLRGKTPRTTRKRNPLETREVRMIVQFSSQVLTNVPYSLCRTYFLPTPNPHHSPFNG